MNQLFKSVLWLVPVVPCHEYCHGRVRAASYSLRNLINTSGRAIGGAPSVHIWSSRVQIGCMSGSTVDESAAPPDQPITALDQFIFFGVFLPTLDSELIHSIQSTMPTAAAHSFPLSVHHARSGQLQHGNKRRTYHKLGL